MITGKKDLTLVRQAISQCSLLLTYSVGRAPLSVVRQPLCPYFSAWGPHWAVLLVRLSVSQLKVQVTDAINVLGHTPFNFKGH